MSKKVPKFTVDEFFDKLETLRNVYKWEVIDGRIRGLIPGYDPQYTTSFRDPLAAVATQVLERKYRSIQPRRSAEDLHMDADAAWSIFMASSNLPDGAPPPSDLFAKTNRQRLLEALGLDAP